MPTASSRARHRLRIASCASSGTQMALSSPARESSASNAVAPIVLDALSGAPWDQRRRDDLTQVTPTTQLTVQAMPCGAGLVDHAYLRRIAGMGQHLEQCMNVRADRADESRRITACLAGCDR